MEKRNGTIIVTGGAGYIGSHTIIELIESTNFNVISIDNFVNSSAETFDRIQQITEVSVKNHDINLCNQKEVQDKFNNTPDLIGVIHFAALKSVPESVNNPSLYYSNNLKSLINVIESCERNKVQSFIFSSSCSVYGDIDTFPVNEESKTGLPKSPYAHTKKIGEEIIKQIATKSPFQSIALRYFNPAGAHHSGLIGELPINQPTTLIPVLMNHLSQPETLVTVYGDDLNTRDGTCIRDYVHVTDIANAHVKALLWSLKCQKEYHVFNLGSQQGTSVLEAIAAVEAETGKKVNYQIGDRRDGDVEAIYSDCRKANEILQWKPQYNIQNIVRSAWKWQNKINKK